LQAPRFGSSRQVLTRNTEDTSSALAVASVIRCTSGVVAAGFDAASALTSQLGITSSEEAACAPFAICTMAMPAVSAAAPRIIA
jgi:hypothetical protein